MLRCEQQAIGQQAGAAIERALSGDAGDHYRTSGVEAKARAAFSRAQAEIGRAHV